MLPIFPLWHGLSGLCVGVCSRKCFRGNWLEQMHGYREAFGLPARSPMVARHLETFTAKDSERKVLVKVFGLGVPQGSLAQS